MKIYVLEMEKQQIEKILSSLGIQLEEKREDQSILQVKSHLNGNNGYYHVMAGDNENVLLKGIHKDFVRVLKGTLACEEKLFSKISDIMSQIAKNIDVPFTAEFQICETPMLISVSAEVLPRLVADKRQFLMRRPLSSVEYNMGKDDFASEKMLYSRGLTASLFPETLSPLTASMVKKVLDVINPFFMHANFKTFSPSIKVMFNKLYANYSNLEVIFRTVKMDESFLQLNYAPHLYVKNTKVKLKSPDMKLLDIDMNEIDEFISDIESQMMSLSFDDMTGDTINEIMSMLVMSGTMVFFLMSESFINIRQRCENWSETLKLIYKTREKTIFHQYNDIQIPESFDFFSELKTVSFEGMPSSVDPQVLMNTMPAKTRMLHKKALLKSLDVAHQALVLRDRLFGLGCELVKKGQAVFNTTGENLIKDCKFSKTRDLQFFEIDELKNIVADNFFGNIPFTKYFKYWQAERFQMQPTPSEIYEKDISEMPKIMGTLYQNLVDQQEIACVSYFHKKCNGVGSLMGRAAGNVVVSRTVPLGMLDQIKDAEAVITENCSIFSCLAEYAAVMDIPIYSGVRFAPQLLSGKTIETGENKIIIRA